MPSATSSSSNTVALTKSEKSSCDTSRATRSCTWRSGGRSWRPSRSETASSQRPRQRRTRLDERKTAVFHGVAGLLDRRGLEADAVLELELAERPGVTDRNVTTQFFDARVGAGHRHDHRAGAVVDDLHELAVDDVSRALDVELQHVIRKSCPVEFEPADRFGRFRFGVGIAKQRLVAVLIEAALCDLGILVELEVQQDRFCAEVPAEITLGTGAEFKSQVAALAHEALVARLRAAGLRQDLGQQPFGADLGADIRIDIPARLADVT